MCSTLLAILASGLVLTAGAAAQELRQQLPLETKPALQAASTQPPSKEESSEKEEHKVEHEEKEAEAWKPETPSPVEEEEKPSTLWPRFQFRAEYLFWWFKDMPLPPVLTRGLVTDINPGALGQPGTVIMLGNENLYEKPQSGVRTSATYWFEPDGCLGVEVGGFCSQLALGGGGPPQRQRPVLPGAG